MNIETDPYTNINTDHFMIKIKVRQKLKARETKQKEPTLKGIRPEKAGKTKEELIE